jgi:hypothetical protein
MKKQFFSLILVLCMAVSILPAISIPASAADVWDYPTVTPSTPFSSGIGTLGAPYEIDTAQELANLAYLINNNDAAYSASTVYYKLTADIVLNDGTIDESSTSAKTWTPIGNFTHLFNGTFDGGGYTVSGIYINAGAIKYQGLFGYINTNGTIKNVGTVNSYICGNQCVGGVVGYNSGITLNCFNSGTITGTVGTIGGVVGAAEKSVTDCYNSGNVSGGQSVGGVVGANTCDVQIAGCYNTGSVSGTMFVGGVKGTGYSSVINCYNTGTVTATDSESYVGGITSFGFKIINCFNTGSVIGIKYVSGISASTDVADQTITSCYNSGSVTGKDCVAGVAGYVYSGREVKDCYNSGSVNGTGTGHVGGIAGDNVGTVSSCYYDKQMCTFGGINGLDVAGQAEGKLTTEMIGSALNSSLSGNVTPFDDPWNYVDNLYPRLANMDNTDAAYISAAPVFLNSANTSAAVTQGFTLGGTSDGVVWTSGSPSVIGISGNVPSIVDEGTAVLTATRGTASRTVTLKVDSSAINAKVTIRKDGVIWTDSGYMLKMYKHGNLSELCIDLTDTNSNGIYTAAVEPATYHIYNGSLDLGLVEVKVGTTGTATLDYYSVSYTGNHISFSPKSTVILGTKDLYPSLSPDSGYTRPASISVTMVGQSSMTLVASSFDADTAGEYYYDATTGYIKIAKVNGAVSISAAGLSSNAHLATILTKTVSAGAEAGTLLAPKTASISVANTVDSVTAANILPTDTGAAVTFYGTDSTYGTPSAGSISLTAGSGTVVYVKITAADSTAMYYAVTINRAAALSNDATLTTILSKTVSADAGLGTALAPKTASISVANAIASVTKTDILPTDTGAAVTFYGTDSTFGTPSSGSISLTAGSGPVVSVKITAADSTALCYAVTINRAAASGGSGSGGSGGSGGTAPAGGAPVIVNKQSYTAGTSKDTIENGKKVTQVTVDSSKLQTILAPQGQNASVVIPVTTGSQVVAGLLTGQMVKNMETKEATLEIQTNSATYTLPASEINIDAVSKQLGASVALSDIQVNVQIAEPSDATVKVVKNAATSNSFSIMVPAVDFSISCTHNGNTVAVSSFNSYVERTIAVPAGVNPTKITTGIVVNADGTTRHVPTKITVVNGKYYATINSLTNSTYAVIWHPIEFADVTKHWAKDAINDMGSRMVVNGVDETNYDPNRDITRAEFAAIVVRALGLAPGTGEKSFGDVAASDWYCGYIKTASSYGIITGYNQTTFGPNDKITREQAMAMIARAMKITGLDATLTDSTISTLMAGYTDTSDASDYAKTSIVACLKTGVVTGRSSSTVAPKENITRAEVAAIVQRLLQQSNLI